MHSGESMSSETKAPSVRCVIGPSLCFLDSDYSFAPTCQERDARILCELLGSLPH